MVTTEQAGQFIGIAADEPLLPALLATAEAMVKGYLRPTGQRRIPDSIRDHAVLTLTGELWNRRNSPGGVASWSPDGATAVRYSRDAMGAVKPLLGPYRSAGAIG